MNLYPATSQTKSHPELVYNLSEEQLQDYLRIWWDTDGHWSTKTSGDHYVGIDLISEKLIKGIQLLLLKLGIHSTISVKVPKIYEGTTKKVYRLVLEGQEAIRRFYKQIRTKKAPKQLIQKPNQSHNRLVVDRRYVYEQLKKHRPKKDKRFYSPSYNVSYEKLKKYLETNIEFPELQKLYDADFHFDRIVAINNLGKRSTTALEIEGIHTFQVDGILTKNTGKSTTLANIMVSNSALIPHFHTLYVAPTVDQTKVFSRDRVAPVIETSPLMKQHYINSSLPQNVFMKQLLNYSKMYLRYALLSADHLRGYSADFNLFDEAQDLKQDIIPVVQETMSRSLYKRTLYSGTPKRTKGTLADL